MRLKKSRYLALEDAIFDSRIPLRSDEEFRVGILFAAKVSSSVLSGIVRFILIFPPFFSWSAVAM